MSQNHRAEPSSLSSQNKSSSIRIGIYFVWGDRLWYVMDMTNPNDTGERLALLEDCYTEDLSWVKVRFFNRKMKEVKPAKC